MHHKMNRGRSVAKRASNSGMALMLCITAFALTIQASRAEAQSAAPDSTLPSMLPPNVEGVLLLFSGKEQELKKNFTNFDGTAPVWKLLEGGSLLAMTNDLITKEEFSDAQMHLEFKTPSMLDAKEEDRGKSGIIFQGGYELHILDSYGVETPGKADCGAVLNEQAPLMNACRASKEWQSFDIIYRAPRYDARGINKLENARVTVFLNGFLVQNNVEMKGGAILKKFEDDSLPRPICLEYGGSAVEFRNIWVLPLAASPRTVAPRRPSTAPVVAFGAGAEENTYLWQDAPAGQRVIARAASFDLEGYQIYGDDGETIVVPFAQDNLAVMKFGRSTTDQGYFVNEKGTPVLYLPEDGFLENAAVQNARWYPIPQNFEYTAPVYVTPVSGITEFNAMGWYPGLYLYGGVWASRPNASFTWTPGYYVSVDGTRFTSYEAYRAYYLKKRGYLRMRRLYLNYKIAAMNQWVLLHRRHAAANGVLPAPGLPNGRKPAPPKPKLPPKGRAGKAKR